VPALGARRSVLRSLLGRAHRRAPPAAAQLRARTAEFVRDIERVWGVEFPPGRNPDLIFMAHLWEPLRVLPKPLALHLASEAAGLACHALLAGLGFRRRSSQARAARAALWCCRAPCRLPGHARLCMHTCASVHGMHALLCTRLNLLPHAFPCLHSAVQANRWGICKVTQLLCARGRVNNAARPCFWRARRGEPPGVGELSAPRGAGLLLLGARPARVRAAQGRARGRVGGCRRGRAAVGHRDRALRHQHVWHQHAVPLRQRGLRGRGL